MASIIFHEVDFAYASATTEVFQGLSLLIDTGWRTGVVGRNGRGKTTLLKLAAGLLEADRGHVERPGPGRYFPAPVAAPERSTVAVVKGAVAPFDDWEARMQSLLEDGSDMALDAYAELHERYVGAGGYDIDARIAREFDAMGLPQDLLARPFGTLSGGEQTRALIVGMFLDTAGFAFIDEPTNHLDMDGRARLTRYLSDKRGFLLVSHDRRLLDGAVDHVLSINRSDVRVNHGNYSQWRAHMDEELAAQRHARARIERDVARLERAARDTRRHAASREADKYRTGAVDKGFIGHRAAKQMKRARSVERRIAAELAEKTGLLGNEEKERRLRMDSGGRRRGRLLTVQNLALRVGGARLFEDLSFAVAAGDRVAVTGRNGCGKTSLFDAIAGAPLIDAGLIDLPGHVAVARAYQRPLWRRGSLRAHLQHTSLDEPRFRQLLGVMGIGADVFERPLQTYSEGELKKVDLCRSLSLGADLLLWDEPLNFVDLHAREQIEEAVLADGPALLFVEHDRQFVDRVAQRIVRLDAR